MKINLQIIIAVLTLLSLQVITVMVVLTYLRIVQSSGNNNQSENSQKNNEISHEHDHSSHDGGNNNIDDNSDTKISTEDQARQPNIVFILADDLVRPFKFLEAIGNDKP